jgi:hypothetical protein
MSPLISGAVRSERARIPVVVGVIVAALLLVQFCVLAEPNPVWRKNLSDLLLVLDCSFSCLFMALAARRSTGSERVFWLLFTASIMVWAVTDTIWLARSLYQVHTSPPPLLAFGYRFYAVPLAVMLLRREQHSGAEPQFIALDWIQTSLVVGLIFAGLLYFPLGDATEQTQAARSQAIADVMNLALLAIALLRRHNESRLEMRRLYLIWFLLSYTVVTFFANRQQFFSASATLAEVSWSVPSLLPGAMAAAWKSNGRDRVRPAPAPPVFRELLTENLLASTLVLGVAVLSDHLPGSGHDWGNVAVAISLFSYSLRQPCCNTANNKKARICGRWSSRVDPR